MSNLGPFVVTSMISVRGSEGASALCVLPVGGDVTDALAAAFDSYASHRDTLTSAIAEASRVYDAGLDKTFCAAACGTGAGDEATEHDEL